MPRPPRCIPPRSSSSSAATSTSWPPESSIDPFRARALANETNIPLREPASFSGNAPSITSPRSSSPSTRTSTRPRAPVAALID
eukprot:7947206-Heterocapsa_arctica.AAC.1